MQAQLAAPSTLEQVPPCVQTNPLHGSWVPHLSPLYPGGQAHVAVLFGPESEQVPPCWHLNPSPHGSVAPAAVNMMASSSVAAHAASAGAPGLRRLVPIMVPALRMRFTWTDEQHGSRAAHVVAVFVLTFWRVSDVRVGSVHSCCSSAKSKPLAC